MEMWYEELQIMSSDGRTTNLHSSSSQDENDEFSSMLRAMINKVVHLKISKQGKILEIRNMDLIFDNMSGLSGGEQMKELFASSFGEKALEDKFTINTILVPDRQLGLGDHWEDDFTIDNNGIPFIIKTEYTLKEITDKFYRISGESEVASTDMNDYVEILNIYAKFDLKGKMTSDLWIDKLSGWTANAMISQDLQGEAMLSEASKWVGGLTLPINITNDISLSTNLYPRTQERQKAIQFIENMGYVESLKDIYTRFYIDNIQNDRSISDEDDSAIGKIIKEKLSENIIQRFSEKEMDELDHYYKSPIYIKTAKFNSDIFENEALFEAIDKEVDKAIKNNNHIENDKQSIDEEKAVYILEKWNIPQIYKRLYLKRSEKYNFENINNDEELLIEAVIRKMAVLQLLTDFDRQDIDKTKAFLETTAFRKFSDFSQTIMPSFDDFRSMNKID